MEDKFRLKSTTVYFFCEKYRSRGSLLLNDPGKLSRFDFMKAADRSIGKRIFILVTGKLTFYLCFLSLFI